MMKPTGKSTPQIVGIDGQPIQKGSPNTAENYGSLHAQARAYDILTNQYCSDNWFNAVRSDSNTINDRETLQRLRDLSRGEKRNNPHLSGLIHKLTNECIGTGPRLTIKPKTVNDRSVRAANRVEQLWNRSVREMNLMRTLRIMCEERVTAGETFAVVQQNRQMTVPINIKLYEAEQFRSPTYSTGSMGTPSVDPDVDGIIFDSQGNVAAYIRLDHHPYSTDYPYTEDYVTIDSEFVYHWFRKERPSQYRGVPEVAPMLDVYSHLRRFIESKVKQEELRSKMLGSLKTGFAPDAGCAELGDKPIDMMIGDGMFTTLPEGWEVQLFDLDVTGEGVQDFIRAALSWATQALLVPWNVTAGDSSDYNFASGRLDHILFYNYVKIVRSALESEFLDWFFNDHWFPTARLARELPGDLGLFETVWHWDSNPAIDPVKEANAAKTLLEAGLLDEHTYWQERGVNAMDVAERQIRFELEKEKMRQDIAAELGVELMQPPTPNNQEGNQDEQETDEPAQA